MNLAAAAVIAAVETWLLLPLPPLSRPSLSREERGERAILKKKKKKCPCFKISLGSLRNWGLLKKRWGAFKIPFKEICGTTMMFILLFLQSNLIPF